MKREQKLDTLFKSYLEQSKSVIPLTVKTSKGSLALLTTLAASALIGADVNAQCGVGSFDPTGGYYSDGALDVDGDGNTDFDFDVFCYTSGGVVTDLYLFMTVATSATMNFGPALLPMGASITTGNANTNNSSGSFSELTDSPAAQTFYIAISNDAGDVGFVEIIIDPTLGCPGFTVNVANTGIEDGLEPAAEQGMAIAGDCATTLPVELVDLALYSDQNGNHLSWSTAFEINNKGFEIQRSMDRKEYTPIGWVEGEGNSSHSMEYGFVDKNTDANVEYHYRLKQTDYDGNFAYSDVISGKYVDDSAVRISNIAPNPVSGNAFLEIYTSESSSAKLQMYNNAGQILKTSTPALVNGTNTVEINTDDLQSGVYYLKIVINDKASYQKVIVL